MKKLYPKRFLFLVSVELYEKLKKLAAHFDVSMGEVLRSLVEKAYADMSN